MNVLQYKCPCCGAALAFSGKSGMLKCASCENEYSVEDVEDYDKQGDSGEGIKWKHAGSAKRVGEGKYICPSCGAEVDCDENTASTICPYCDNVVLLSDSLSGEFGPDSVIPFKVEGQRARELLLRMCRGKPLLPRGFVDKNKVKNITGHYVPNWLFDCDCDADMSFDATRVRSWSDSKYNYTETSHYLVERAGHMSFRRIPVDGSVKMEDDITEAVEPYDYSELTGFKPAYLAGFSADRFDIDADTATDRANERVFNSAEAALRDTVKGYATVSVRRRNAKTENGSVSYALLPLWLFEAKYDDTLYQFAINGQTAKLIGQLPVSRGRFWGWLLGLTLGGTVLLSLLLMLIEGML